MNRKWLIVVTALMGNCVALHDVTSGEETPMAMSESSQRYSHAIGIVGRRDNKPATEWILDTGAPISLANSPTYGTVFFEKIVFGGQLTVTNMRCTAASAGLNIMGANIFGGGLLTINYRDHWVSVSDTPPVVSGVDESAPWIPFVLEGSEPRVPAAASRIRFDGKIEGQTYRFILDTGATSTAVAKRVSNRLLSDGRRFQESRAKTVSAEVVARVFRTLQLEIGGKTYQTTLMDGPDDVWFSSKDANLGGAFLEGFLVTIDYRKSRLRLQQYQTQDHVLPPYVSIPISFRSADASDGGKQVYVDRVYSTTQDVSGLMDAELLSVDGSPVREMTWQQLIEATAGSIGTTHLLRWADGREINLAVEDLLSL